MSKEDPQIRSDGQSTHTISSLWRITRLGLVLVADTWTLVERWGIERQSHVRIGHIGGSVGIADDPTDEKVHWILTEIDQDGVLPSTVEVGLEESDWSAENNWRSIGTDAGPTQTIEKIDEDIDVGHTSNPPANSNSLGLLVHSNTTSTVDIALRIELIETMKQREFRDDPSEWSGYEFEETIA